MKCSRCGTTSDDTRGWQTKGVVLCPGCLAAVARIRHDHKEGR